MRILWDLPQQGSAKAALEERHKIGCKRKGRVDFALFIPASLNLMPVDNEPKHGGVAEPSPLIARMSTKRKEKNWPIERIS
jgi:hypothetical protein